MSVWFSIPRSPSWAAAASATQPTTAPSFIPPDEVIARVNGSPITMAELQTPLVQGYGLNILLRLVQLEIAKQFAAEKHVTITHQDIQTERSNTIEKMFEDSNTKLQDRIDNAKAAHDDAEAARLTQEMEDDNERAFHQFLDQQHQTEADFDLVCETNAYLRKVAQPMVTGKLTDAQLREAFAAMYGETIQCRHIQCATLQEIQEAKRRLADGEPFAKVARELSRNEATRVNGGELPPFSRDMPGLPQAFKDAAFALKPGEVSDIVQADGSFHLILLEKRNPPKAVKFEDVKESIRKELHSRAIEVTIRQLRKQIQDHALAVLTVEDPILKKQLDARVKQRQAEQKSREDVRREIDRSHRDRTDSDRPALPPPGGSVTSPATAP